MTELFLDLDGLAGQVLALDADHPAAAIAVMSGNELTRRACWPHSAARRVRLSDLTCLDGNGRAYLADWCAAIQAA